MEQRLYVANLPFTLTEKEIAEIFSAYGTVKSVLIMPCRLTGQRSRGVAYVTMDSRDNALQAMASLDGGRVDGHNLVVNQNWGTPVEECLPVAV